MSLGSDIPQPICMQEQQRSVTCLSFTRVLCLICIFGVFHFSALIVRLHTPLSELSSRIPFRSIWCLKILCPNHFLFEILSLHFHLPLVTNANLIYLKLYSDAGKTEVCRFFAGFVFGKLYSSFFRSPETVLKWIGKLKYKEINSWFVFFQWKEQKQNNYCHLCLKLSANAIFTCQINHPLLCYPPHSKKERKYMEKHAKQMSHLPWIRSIDKL